MGKYSGLEEYMKRGTDNRVENLRTMEVFEAMKMEPKLSVSKLSVIRSYGNCGYSFSDAFANGTLLQITPSISVLE